ncbi:type 1 fimbrial protein, partial [Klebsiella pneumoniae]|nr:type 1 fimbrial protein [Klebsiella pneumoniae]
MKEKGTVLVVVSLLALCLATFTTARAAGTLNFTGKFINESCQIANNGGDVIVDVGNVDMSALRSHEAKTA